MMMVLFILLLVIAVGGGGLGYSRYGAGGGLGPIGLVLVIFSILYFTGNLHM